MSANDSVSKSWNPWPWAIIGFFVIFIGCVVAFVVFATRQPMDLVRHDYYEEELRYQKRIDSAQRAQALPGTLSVQYAPRPEQLIISLPPATRTASKGTVHLYRPSDAQLDRTLELSFDASARQVLDVPGLKPGLWKLRFAWELLGETYSHEESVVIPPKTS
jgi:hypothetical protein